MVEDLLARTHKRAYLAVLRGDHLRVVLERGLQGMPKLPGMSPEIRDNAHALALGKVVLARAPADALERYLTAGLRRFTPATITEPDVLRAELRRVRRTGIAVDREEIRPRLLLHRRPRPRRATAGSSARSASRCRVAPSTRSVRRSKRRSATSSDSRHLRIVAKFLIHLDAAGLASSAEHLAVKRRVRQRR